MKLMTKIVTAAALTVFAPGITPAFAGNAGDSLNACVKHVVATCNANAKRPARCAKNGTKACEKLHSGKKKPTSTSIINQLKAAGVPATR